MNTFPPLPRPFDVAYHGDGEGAFSAQQMRDYVAADRAKRPAWDEPAIRAMAGEIAENVARNTSVAPQLCFPHIYLGLKKAIAQAAPGETHEL